MAKKSPHYKDAFVFGDVHVMPNTKAHAILEADKKIPNEHGGWLSPDLAARAIIEDALKKEASFYK